MTQQIFILEANGDDYHGSYVVKAYNSRELAEIAKRNAESINESCAECGHTHFYTINEIELGGENE